MATKTNLGLRTKLWRGFLWFIAVVTGILVAAFLGDYGMYRVRIFTGRNAYGSVVVRHYYAIPQKSGKTELIFDPPAPWTCVNSLFPHEGYPPCWYLSRHPEQRTDM